MIVIFTVYIFSRIFKKRELSENINNANISMFTVLNPTFWLIKGSRVSHWSEKNHCTIFLKL